jgi:hypothetical protein
MVDKIFIHTIFYPLTRYKNIEKTRIYIKNFMIIFYTCHINIAFFDLNYI